MQRPPERATVPTPPASRARLLGWIVAANSLAVGVALVGASPAAVGAAHQVALWCGIG